MARVDIPIVVAPPFLTGVALVGVAGDTVNDMQLLADQVGQLHLILSNRHTGTVACSVSTLDVAKTFRRTLVRSLVLPASLGARESHFVFVVDSVALASLVADGDYYVALDSADANFSLVTCYGATWVPTRT